MTIESKEIIEVIRESRKAGMQAALLLFSALLLSSILFGYYIYKSFNLTPSGYIEASQENDTGNNTINQEINNGQANNKDNI